jgi:hypothetical protein
MLVLLCEKPNRKKEGKKKKEELLHSILARFPSHVHSGFFSFSMSLLSFCVVSGKTAREIARV